MKVQCKMKMTSSMRVHFAAIAIFANGVLGEAQCYYPNGSEAPAVEKPCSSAPGSACCPDTWQCLDNGLCHLPIGNLFGRYSCTDKDWDSPGCATNLCTYGMSLGGGESITQCPAHADQWCCNADAQHVNCCQESPSPRPFFTLPHGEAYATIGLNQAASNPILSTITGSASDTSSSGSLLQISTYSATSHSASAIFTSVPLFTSVHVMTHSDSGGVQTIIVPALVTPPVTTHKDTPGSNGRSNSRIGLIVGCAVGIPLAIALMGSICWIACRRRRESTYSQDTQSTVKKGTSFPQDKMVKVSNKSQMGCQPLPRTIEIDGSPLGPTHPVSAIPGFAELESGTIFLPGQGMPYTPDSVGLGGGNGHDRSSGDSMPPQYSQRLYQRAFSQRRDVSEGKTGTTSPAIKGIAGDGQCS